MQQMTWSRLSRGTAKLWVALLTTVRDLDTCFGRCLSGACEIRVAQVELSLPLLLVYFGARIL